MLFLLSQTTLEPGFFLGRCSSRAVSDGDAWWSQTFHSLVFLISADNVGAVLSVMRDSFLTYLLLNAIFPFIHGADLSIAFLVELWQIPQYNAIANGIHSLHIADKSDI